MHHRLPPLLLLVCLFAAFTACNKLPDHARYIPKDAVLVVGVNGKSLSKKVAWNVITGSKLYKQMQERLPANSKDAMSGLENAGIDIMNTLYVYTKCDKRYKNSNNVTAVIPLSSAADWEAYVKRSFPGSAVRQQNNRKEAALAQGMYAGWTDKVLLIINVLPRSAGYGNTDTTALTQPRDMDDAALVAGMDAAFTVSKDNALTGDKRFNKLQEGGKDITLWTNYDQLITNHGTEELSGMMGGFSLSNTLWKDAALAAGFDFVKGQITGDVRYYISPELASIGKEMGGTNAGKDMIDRLPAQNLDMLMAWHLSPKGLKDLLDKLGVLGFANIALSAQNINTDYVFDAFTGDMAIAVNDFNLVSRSDKAFVADSETNEYGTVSTSYKPSFEAIYVIGINKKENFRKLLQMAADNGLQALGNNTYVMPVSVADSVFIMTNDKYAVIANRRMSAASFIQGQNKGQKLPAAANVYGHPFSMYFDIQQMFRPIDGSITHSMHDSAMIAESKKLLDNMVVNGGSYSDDAFVYHLSVSFMNKEENSILDLLDFGMRVSDVNKIK